MAAVKRMGTAYGPASGTVCRATLADLDDLRTSLLCGGFVVRGLELRGQPLLDTLEQVPVSAEGRQDVGVAEPLLDREGTCSHVDQLRSVRMAEVVGPERCRE